MSEVNLETSIGPEEMAQIQAESNTRAEEVFNNRFVGATVFKWLDEMRFDPVGDGFIDTEKVKPKCFVCDECKEFDDTIAVRLQFPGKEVISVRMCNGCIQPVKEQAIELIPNKYRSRVPYIKVPKGKVKTLVSFSSDDVEGYEFEAPTKPE